MKNQKKEEVKTFSQQEQEQILKDNCESTEMFNYSKPYNDEEMVVIKDRYSQNGIEIQKIEEEKKQVIDEFKARLKPLEMEKNELLESVKHKAKLVSETVYLIADQELGNMDYTNSEGTVVYSRKLMPNEKQVRMELVHKGTNNK
jgi:hypothetical protein